MNLCYISGTVDCFNDYCIDTFSLLWIENSLEQLDHEVTKSLNVYWSLPRRKDITNGLYCIEKDSHILAMTETAMTEAVKEQKTLCLLVDHTNFCKTTRYDVIVNGGPGLPLVISHRKLPKSIVVDVVTSGSKRGT